MAEVRRCEVDENLQNLHEVLARLMDQKSVTAIGYMSEGGETRTARGVINDLDGAQETKPGVSIGIEQDYIFLSEIISIEE